MRLWLVAAFIIALLGIGSAANDKGVNPSLYAMTSSAVVNSIQLYYNATCGLFGGYPLDFWTTANAIEAMANYANATGDQRFDADIPNTFEAVSTLYFRSGYFDDQLW